MQRTATAGQTLRFFASCRAAGCKGRKVIDRPRLASHSNLDIECPDCGLGYMTYRQLRGKFNSEKTCDGRCLMAKGPNCECECGGENHGKHRAG